MKTVGDVMTHDVVTGAPDDGLQRAAQPMRDITIRAAANGLAPDAYTIADVMSGDVARCFQDPTVGEVQPLMAALAMRQPGPMDAVLEDGSRPYPPRRAPSGKAPGTH